MHKTCPTLIDLILSTLTSLGPGDPFWPRRILRLPFELALLVSISVTELLELHFSVLDMNDSTNPLSKQSLLMRSWATDFSASCLHPSDPSTLPLTCPNLHQMATPCYAQGCLTPLTLPLDSKPRYSWGHSWQGFFFACGQALLSWRTSAALMYAGVYAKS